MGGLSFRDYDPHEQVKKETWKTSWDCGDDKTQAEPDWVDTKKFSQTTTNTKQDAVIPRTA